MVDAVGMRCRSCRGDAGDVVLDLGRQPAWDRMPWRDEPLPDPDFLLRMWCCRSCGLSQLCSDADASDELFGVEPRSVAEQSDRSIARLDAEGLVLPGATVAEFGSPHGESWLGRLSDAGMVTAAGRTADLVVDFYGLLHDADQDAALRARTASLAPGGTLAVQMLTLGTVLSLRQWFDLRHGHYAYWSLPTLDAALRRHGLGVHRAWRYPLSGGTILLTANRDPRPDAATLRLIDEERTVGVDDVGALCALQGAAESNAAALRGWLVSEREAGRTVAAYGAASRSVPVVSHAGLDSGLLSVVGDASPAKQGRRMPGTDIPIVTPGELVDSRPDRVLLFLPELADEVRETVPGIEAAGGRWVLLDPSLRVLEPALML
ncbi:class I SAM-dependent methyltransferase [Pseudonocardia endophytica]|uniref:Putative zinc binding protein n=1 Tax=Pseudonocardia endophytica TaxID=401976 RepID=A0A4R1I313_PSEEN|nr:class I SAM-dependent methyltransferase [Pseudonocardia endophytica]TCK27710.1 putative zinc binding protein [Pseudonocardia endophytica]